MYTLPVIDPTASDLVKVQSMLVHIIIEDKSDDPSSPVAEIMP